MNPPERLSEDGLVIYLFHGVIDRQRHSVRNYTRKHLERAPFREMLTELKRAGQPLSMDQVVALHSAGEPYPARSFAITFDDGFANNYTVAAPVLAELALPATFYITSGFVEHNAMSWIDRIEFCIEQTPRGALRLPWRTAPLSFDNRESKIALLNEIRLRVKSDPAIGTEDLVASVFEQCNHEGISASDDPLDQKLTWAEVRALAEDPLFTVGGHSHTHPILSFLSAEKLGHEIDLSLELLAEMAGLLPRHYSYPEGLAHCYSPQVISALQARGIVCCPTAEDGVNAARTDLFHLKRVMVS